MVRIGRLAPLLVPVALATATPAAATAAAAPGDLDGRFGSGGVATAAFPQGASRGTAVAVAPDGRVVIAARRERTGGAQTVQDWVAARFTADGRPDTTFDGDGRSQPLATSTVTGVLAEGAEALAVLADGSVLVGGQLDTVAGVGKLTPTGTTDTDFGLNGVVRTATIPGATRVDVTGLAVQPDGRIVAGGSAFSGGHLTPFVARFTADGQPDATFASGPIAFVPPSACDDVPATDCTARGLALETSGATTTAIYLGGGNEGDLVGGRVWRFVPPASPPGPWTVDTTFGDPRTPGAAQIPRSRVNEVDALLRTPDGRIVASGLAQSGPSFQCGLARVNPSGALDATFGAGRVDLSGTCRPAGLARTADGRFVVGATVSDGPFGAGASHLGVARFTADGRADASFAAGGGRVVDGAAAGVAGGVALQGGDVLLAGGRGAPSVAVVARVAGGDLSGGPGPGPGGPPSKLPHVSGVAQVGGRLSCDPGSLAGTLDYTWFMVGGDGSSAAIGSGPVLTVPGSAEGFGVECFVHRAGDTAGYDSDNRVAVKVAATPQTFPSFTRALKDYLPGTKVCGAKRYCTDDEVRSDLERQGFNLDWASVKVQTHRGKVPARLRDDLAPGAVIDLAASPIADGRVTSGPGRVVRFAATIFRPRVVPRKRCPFGADLLTIGDRDFQLDDLLRGQTFAEAKGTLRTYHCYKVARNGDERAVEYAADLHPSRTAATTRVTAVRIVRDRTAPHGRLVRLDVEVPVARLALDVRAERSATGTSPTLGLADQGLTAGRGVTSFAVHVSTTSGIDARNVVVELRDGKGEAVDFQRTDAQGTAHFKAPAPRRGTYELSATLADRDGDALVGYEPIRAVDRKRAPFTDLAGARWVYDAGRKQYGRSAATRGAHAVRAQLSGPESTELTALRQQAATMLSRLQATVLLLHSATCIGMTPAQVGACAASGGAVLSQLLRGTPGQLGAASQAFATLLPALRRFVDTGDLTASDLVLGLTTLGGHGTLALGTPTAEDVQALALDGTRLRLQTRTGLVPGTGTLSLSAGPIQLLADGSFIVAQGGGNLIGNDGASVSPFALDAQAVNFDLQPMARIVAQGGGNVAAPGGSVLITVPGAKVLTNAAGSLITNDGASILSEHGVGIVAQGGGNLISNDGGSIVAQGGGNIIADNGGG